MSSSVQCEGDPPTTVLPENLSFLGPQASRSVFHAGGRSWLFTVSWWLFGPVVKLAIFSSVVSLAVGVAVWWMTPSWLFTSAQWLPKLTGGVEASGVQEWALDTLKNLEALGRQAPNEPPAETRPDDPASSANETPDITAVR